MKTILQIVVGVACVVLGYMFYESMMDPIRFNESLERRKNRTIERLKDIRELQVVYKNEHGAYTGSFDTLINFYKTGVVKIVKQIGSEDDSIAVAKKLIVRDTIKIPVKETVFLNRPNFVVDSLRKIPFVGGEFQMKAGIFETISKVKVPLFEASVEYNTLLAGLERQYVVNMNDDLGKLGRFKGVKVGNVEAPNNNAGNWE